MENEMGELKMNLSNCVGMHPDNVNWEFYLATHAELISTKDGKRHYRHLNENYIVDIDSGDIIAIKFGWYEL